MTIIRDNNAPVLKRIGSRLTRSELQRLSDAGLTLICSTDQDNEREHWFITNAGQILRRTGMKLERAVIFTEDEAFEQLGVMATDEGLLRAWSKEELATLRQAPATPTIPLSHD